MWVLGGRNSLCQAMLGLRTLFQVPFTITPWTYDLLVRKMYGTWMLVDPIAYSTCYVFVNNAHSCEYLYFPASTSLFLLTSLSRPSVRVYPRFNHKEPQ